MKQTSMTFRVNGRDYTFAPGQLVPYLFRLGTRRAPPLSCEARVFFVSADEAEPLIRLGFTHPRLHTEETRWLTGKQFWRAAPGPAQEWRRSLCPTDTGPLEGGIDREHALSVLRAGKRLSKRLDLLQGRDLIHLLTDNEQAFITQRYGPIRCYFLGLYPMGDDSAPSWHEQQQRGHAFEARRREARLSVHEFALLDAALLELQHERAVEDVLRTFQRRADEERSPAKEEKHGTQRIPLARNQARMQLADDERLLQDCQKLPGGERMRETKQVRWKKVASVEHLRELAGSDEAIDVVLLLRGGIRSSKRIAFCWKRNGRHWWVWEGISDSEGYYTERQLAKDTSIITAIAHGALFAEIEAVRP